MSELHDAVREAVRGNQPSEAGVELLIRGGKAIYERAPWLLDIATPVGAPRQVHVEVGLLLAEARAWSSGERTLATFAAALLGGPQIDLGEISRLDRAGLDLVLAALAHAAGSHEHSALTFDASGAPDGFATLDSLYPWPSEA